jgi:hypothetical protein
MNPFFQIIRLLMYFLGLHAIMLTYRVVHLGRKMLLFSKCMARISIVEIPCNGERRKQDYGDNEHTSRTH